MFGDTKCTDLCDVDTRVTQPQLQHVKKHHKKTETEENSQYHNTINNICVIIL